MNRVKAILFDVDGVLIRPPYFFSKELEQNGYSKAEKTLNAYYGSDDHLPSLEGRGTCEEAIAPYLRDFGWQQTPPLLSGGVLWSGVHCHTCPTSAWSQGATAVPCREER